MGGVSTTVSVIAAVALGSVTVGTAVSAPPPANAPEGMWPVVDNGPMAPSVAATGLLEHLRVDGFAWKPRKPVEWMVCDMVEQPSRIAPLMAEWVASGRCRRSIFNLKLPMKRRYDEIERCRALIDQRMRAGNIKYILRIKHLYHDREEVTCYLTRR